MTDFLLELLSEEIPARMQAKASADLARLFGEQLAAAGLAAEAIETYATPRRLALIARGLPAETAAVSEELKGPRTSAPPQALEGFLRKTGLTQDQLTERDGVYFAVIEKPGRATKEILAERLPLIVWQFPWPKSMRWGKASIKTDSLRWVRPLQGMVAILGDEPLQISLDMGHLYASKTTGETALSFVETDLVSGAATVGHRFHHPGAITLGGAHDYVEKLRACHVIVDPAERRQIIADGARKAAADAGLTLVEDDGLLAENAGLTEWPVPLLGAFDPAFLEVPREVIQLTLRTNQKYFVLTQSSPSSLGEGDHARHGGGAGPGAVTAPPSALRAATSPSKLGEDLLAPAFLCVANIDAADGGARIVEGNRKVLAARLADARFFWEQDLKVPLEEQAKKLSQIVFHEKLGTVADKVERVAKLARWLVEEGIVSSSPVRGGGARSATEGLARRPEQPLHHQPPAGGPPPRTGEELAALAERAARLCKADLVTGLVGEFPELQGIIGGHLARAQGEPEEIADAIRDHYKPVGQGDEVPTAPVTVAVSLADKLDTLHAFFVIDEKPTGSKDPYALRRAALGVIALVVDNELRLPLLNISPLVRAMLARDIATVYLSKGVQSFASYADDCFEDWKAGRPMQRNEDGSVYRLHENLVNKQGYSQELAPLARYALDVQDDALADQVTLLDFFADRLKVQQREAGVRHDLIDAVFALGGEDDLVRLLARVKALQSFVETKEGGDLLAGYKRAANILKKEGWPPAATQDSARPEHSRGALAQSPSERPSTSLGTSGDGEASHEGGEGEREGNKPLSYTPEKEEAALIAALDSAAPRAAEAVAAEDFEGAMAALASLRAPVDAFFDKVTVNDPDPAKRTARLDLLARMRDAVHRVADFSRIEG